MIRLTNRQKLEELRAFIQICFAMMDETDLKEVANRTGLSVSTLNRIQTERLTLAVQYRTVQALGLAAGLRLELTDKGARMEMVR